MAHMIQFDGLASRLVLGGLLIFGAGARAQVAASGATVPADAPQAQGVPLDRVVAVVNGSVILDSDVDEERRFEALQPYRESDGGFVREKAIERLINRELILQQASLQPEDKIPDADVQKELDGLRKAIPECKRYGCDTKAGWDRFLAERGFTEQSLTERWRKRMEVLRFIEERFRMGIKVTPVEIKSYYTKNMLPAYAKQKVAPPTLESLNDRIQEVLLQERVSNLLSDWLKSLRAQGSVVVMHQGEDAP